VQAFTYNGLGLTTTKTDELGSTTSFGYDEYGNLISTTDALGFTETRTYNAIGLITQEIDQSGNTATYQYDSIYNLIQYTRPDGSSEGFTYNQLGELVGYQDGNGSDWTYTRNARGDPIQIIDPDGGITAYTYDAIGNVVSITDANGNTKSLTYNGKGQNTLFTDSLGFSTIFKYDSEGRVVERQYPLGETEIYEYDLMGHLVNITSGYVYTLFAYDAMGRRTQETHFDGSWTYSYDSVGRRISNTDPVGRTTSLQYDAASQLLAVVDPLGNSLNYEYNAIGQLVKTTQPTGEVLEYQYTPTGQLKKRIDPNGAVTDYFYDSMDQLIRKQYSDGGFVDYTYDNNHNLASIINRDIHSILDDTYYKWDFRGNLVNFTTVYNNPADVPFSHEILYQYDAVGNRIQRSDPYGTANYVYDANDRLIQVLDSPSGVTSTYDYDANGRRILWNNGATTVYYQYDNAQLLVNQTVVAPFPGGAPPTTTTNYLMTYDSVGRLIQKHSINPVLGLNDIEQYIYDSSGLLTRYDYLAPFFAEYEDRTYDGAGRLIQIQGNTTGALVAETHTWDASNRLMSIDNTTHLQQFIYDTNGNRITEKTNGIDTRKYYYDFEDRIVRIDFLDQGYTLHLAWQPQDRILYQTYNGTINSAKYNVWDLTQTLGFWLHYETSSWSYEHVWYSAQIDSVTALKRNIAVTFDHHQLSTNNNWHGPYWGVSSSDHQHRTITYYSGLELLEKGGNNPQGIPDGSNRSPGPGMSPEPDPATYIPSPMPAGMGTTTALIVGNQFLAVLTASPSMTLSGWFFSEVVTENPVDTDYLERDGTTGIGTDVNSDPTRLPSYPAGHDGPTVVTGTSTSSPVSNPKDDEKKAEQNINLDDLFAGLLAELLDEFLDAILDAVLNSALAKVLKGMLGSLGKTFGDEIDSFVEKAMSFSGIKDLLAGALKKTSLWNKIKNAVKDAAGAILAEAIPDWLKDLAKKLLKDCNPLDKIRDDLLGKLKDFFKGKIGKLAGEIADKALKLSGLCKALKKLGAKLRNRLLQKIIIKLARLGLKFIPIIGQIMALYDLAETIWDLLPSEWKDGIKQWLKDAWDTLSNGAKAVWEGVKGLGKKFINTLKGIFNAVVEEAKKFISDPIGYFASWFS
jgi:YD repeat-containing protein